MKKFTDYVNCLNYVKQWSSLQLLDYCSRRELSSFSVTLFLLFKAPKACLTDINAATLHSFNMNSVKIFLLFIQIDAKTSKTINLIFLHSCFITSYQGTVSSIVVEQHDLSQLNPEPLNAAYVLENRNINLRLLYNPAVSLKAETAKILELENHRIIKTTEFVHEFMNKPASSHMFRSVSWR